MPITEIIENNEELAPLVEAVNMILDLPDENLNDSMVESINNMLNVSITPEMRETAIKTMTDSYRKEGYTRAQVQEIVASAKRDFASYADSLNPSPYKRQMIDNFFNVFYGLFDESYDRYMRYDITLNIQLDAGAQVPTYAHASDAAADLYALEDMVLPAHSLSNRVHTGVHIQLPEGWMAMIFPRSSIGAKTGLRLSNSAGIIDQGYLGELGVLYDNLSDSDYTIHAGDRVAQMMILPSYRFKANVVDELVETDRGGAGFGSTGK